MNAFFIAVAITIHTIISCSPSGSVDEASLSSSSATRTPSSSSSSIDCSLISSSSAISEDLCLDFDPNEEIEHYGKMKRQFCDERDGKRYVYVQIGEQIWMAENLNYAICGSKCGESFYSTSLKDTNTEVCDKFGRLYDWHTAMTVCPDGWHLPSDIEWAALTDYVGGSAGTKLKVEGWSCKQPFLAKRTELGWGYSMMDSIICDDRIKEGADDYGFSALPGGRRDNYFFNSVGRDGFWWSDEEFQINEFQIYAYYRSMSSYDNYVSKHYEHKINFLSVRCVKSHDN